METDDNNMQERDAEIDKINGIVQIIVDEMGMAKCGNLQNDLKLKRIDLDLSDEIAGFLMTVYTCLRKEENETTKLVMTGS
ncbi:hypothetical protein JYU34_022544 [Plutella xylostella]|uniref:Uncharacterized protein n=1 Tax=Plutella xylostella TaxID=51655 RepID=A0ABQ7PQ48_PLUXY|nr:hypothetical protein JYU34_022544 [Plutella xylostella]